MPEKVKKETKSVLLTFYQGGTKARVDSSMEPSALKNEMEKSRKEMRDAEIDAVNPDAEIADDKFYVTRNALMFYSIVTPVTKSAIVSLPKSGIIT